MSPGFFSDLYSAIGIHRMQLECRCAEHSKLNRCFPISHTPREVPVIGHECDGRCRSQSFWTLLSLPGQMVSSLICFCVLFVFSIVLIGWQLAESLSFQERPGECRTVSCGSEILSSNELEGWHLSHTISHSARRFHDIKCTYTINYQPLHSLKIRSFSV